MPFVRLEGPPAAKQAGRKFVVLEKSKDPRATEAYRREKTKARERDKLRKEVSSKGIGGFGGKRAGGLLDSIMPLPVGDEIRGGMFALGNEAMNLVRRATGGEPVDSRAIYLANKDAENEFVAQRRKELPVTSVVGEVLAGSATKPAQVVAKAAPALPAVRSAGEKALSIASGAAKAGGAGGMFGFLYGAADDEGLKGRLENGLEAVVPGALGGVGAYAALGALAPVAKATPKVASDVWRGLTTRPPPPGVRPTATPAQAERAAMAVEKIAARQGMTPEAVSRIADDVYKGKPVTAAEILGREGVTQLAATARRAGSTADELEALLRARQAGAGTRILDDAERTLRVSPAAAGGSIDEIVEAGQARAKPLYERALGGDPPIWNNELAGLSGRPVVKEAMRAAATSLRNAGKNPEALGLGFVDAPDAFMSTRPPSFDGPDLPKAPRGPARAPSRGKSLLKFISEGRGITDAADELAAMDAPQWHKGKAYARPLAGDGASLDDWALKAWEEGYFPQHQSRPSERELLDAIRQELRGKPIYARQADQAAQTRFDAREAFDELAYRGGDPADLPTPEQYGGRPEPDLEPAWQAEPTAAAWDHVKKALDALVERDRVTGQVIRTGKVGIRNRDIEAAARDMRLALAGDKTRPGAIPGYREALDASGDYLSVQSAYSRAQGSLMRGSVRDFGRVWGSAKTPAEREAIRAAMANDLLLLAERGHLRGGKFSAPGMQQKLELAFGKKGAAEFIAKMEAEAALARSSQRMMPGAGSPTMELAEAAGDQGSLLSDVARIGGKAATGQGRSAAFDAIGSVFSRVAAYAKTAGTPVEVRDEFGRLLSMSADEFAAFLKTRQPTAVRGPDGAWIFPAQIGGRIAGQAASMSE